MPLEQDPEEGSYASYDPSTVRPAPLDPPQSSSGLEADAPVGDTESHAEADVNAQAASFDERHKEPFHGLMYLGALSKTFTWAGHEFHIRTLTTDEILIVALITARYEGTLAQNRAYSAAVVALATQSVDGEPLPFPYMESTGHEWADQRFNYVTGKWYSFTIDAVYSEYLVLEAKAREVMNAMGNLSG
jgi:hypothetical protein